jgi:hypothetical protein
MIVLFTDFGLQGPYTGQFKAVLHQMAPGVRDRPLRRRPGRQSKGISLLVGGGTSLSYLLGSLS